MCPMRRWSGRAKAGVPGVAAWSHGLDVVTTFKRRGLITSRVKSAIQVGLPPTLKLPFGSQPSPDRSLARVLGEDPFLE